VEVDGPLLADFLDEIRPTTTFEKVLLTDTSTQVLAGCYAHLRQKSVRYGIDPLARLAALRRDIRTASDRQFREDLFGVFASLRDLHTSIKPPPPLARSTAVLPFLVEACRHRRDVRYLVTKVADPALADVGLRPGVQVSHWNGVPIDLAVARNALRTRGANPAASLARGIERLTIRPLADTLAPDEHWVEVTFAADDNRRCRVIVPWRVLPIAADLSHGRDAFEQLFARPAEEPLDLAFDPAGRAAQVVKRELYSTPRAEEVPTELTEMFRPEIRRIRRRERAYLRIWSFMHRDDEAVLNEFIRLLAIFDDRGCAGLVVDIRGNPGGVVVTAERLLQTLTDRPITPVRFAFAPTRLTQQLVANDPELAGWQESIQTAEGTGEPYSRALPITPIEAANDSHRCTDMPAVLIIDATSYSAADVFAAGWVDHAIGPIIGTTANTGAGGANVWSYDQIRARLDPDGPVQLPTLQDGSDLRVAVRRAVRTGAADGIPIEDIGIPIEAADIHQLTTRDVVHGNEDLLRFAVDRLNAVTAANP